MNFDHRTAKRCQKCKSREEVSRMVLANHGLQGTVTAAGLVERLAELRGGRASPAGPGAGGSRANPPSRAR